MAILPGFPFTDRSPFTVPVASSLESVTRPLASVDCVFTGTPWPGRGEPGHVHTATGVRALEAAGLAVGAASVLTSP